MSPGAIAILQLHGQVESILGALTGTADWPVGRARVVSLAGVDEGLAVRLGDGVAQIMPHGGPRVRQLLIGWLAEHGVEQEDPDRLDPELIYPEAADRYEALALAAAARASSPAAIDLLLDQPRRWRIAGELTAEDRARSTRLNHLIDPPVVVVVGPANVGKSTLANSLVGRTLSIAADLPGTTRDYTAGRIDLGGLVVDWHDTPGVRDPVDSIERTAGDLARTLMERADLLVAMTDAEHTWPLLRRAAGVYVINKIDRYGPARRPSGGSPDVDPVRISALTGAGIGELVTAVRERLVPAADRDHPGPWLFDDRLTRLA